MLLNRKSVELLAPAGTWDALVAGVEAGADACYLGGSLLSIGYIASVGSSGGKADGTPVAARC